jgi:hypothetical protein
MTLADTHTYLCCCVTNGRIALLRSEAYSVCIFVVYMQQHFTLNDRQTDTDKIVFMETTNGRQF